jgi:hypothetical protein
MVVPAPAETPPAEMVGAVVEEVVAGTVATLPVAMQGMLTVAR